MTRLVVDSGSDDEFPDLEELVATRRVGVKKVASLTVRSVRSTREDEKKIGNASRPVQRDSEREKVIGEKIDHHEVGKRKPKKRVLNQKSDNPLLRPFSSASSELLGEGSKKKGKALRMKQVTDSIEKDPEFLSTSFHDQRMEVKERPDERTKKERTTERNPWKNMESIKSKEQDLDKVRRSKVETVRSKPVRNTAQKARSKSPPKFESDEEEDFGLESDGLSDFIVDDSTFLENEDAAVEEPRSVRRLVQGRKPSRDEESDDEDLEIRVGKLAVEEDMSTDLDKALKGLSLEDFGNSHSDDDFLKTKPKKGAKIIKSKAPSQSQGEDTRKALPPSSDTEVPFTLRYSPSMIKPRKSSKDIRFATPPRSPEPKPRGLVSPKKQLPRIPLTPHRPSMDSFWQQDVVNDWNDEYSPRKALQPQPQLKNDGSLSLDSLPSPKKSLAKQGRITKEAKKSFSQKKHALAESFLQELDNKITNGEISRLAAQTGGVQIVWSKKLNTTAGRANWKRETIQSSRSLSISLPAPQTYRHYASIELAEKVIDEEDRLLNVVAHEFCHLANFMISNIKTNPHGKEFKEWGEKVTRMFGERGVVVTTKHSYDIDYKFVWECENCGMEFKRHSRSIDPERHRCGNCKSELVQTKPVPRAGKENGGKEKGLGEYQMFVKANMSRVRQENPGSPQKDIMGLVGKKYQEYKASKLNEKMIAVETVDIVEDVERTPKEDGAEFVARKLDFLDLTRE